MIDNTNEQLPKDKIDFDTLTYKDTTVLSAFLNEQGKILPRRITGLTSKQQKKIKKLLKTARIAAVLPFVVGNGFFPDART